MNSQDRTDVSIKLCLPFAFVSNGRVAVMREYTADESNVFH